MKYLLTLALLGIVIAGCASRPKDNSSRGNRDIANVAPEGRLTESLPTETGPSLPAMTANPAPIVLTPVQGSTQAASAGKPIVSEGWQAFTSTTLGVTLNYPSDWSVAEEADGAIFTSPTGATIQLKGGTALQNNNEFRIGNQACTSRTTEHGQTARICVDNASFTYTASFSIQKADGSTEQVILVTKTRTVGKVFEGMLNSLAPAS